MEHFKSDFKVEVVEVEKIVKHPNADSLSIVTVHSDYPCIVRTVDFKVGDLAVYVPVEAIVPVNNSAFMFLKRSETQTTHRVKASKLRGTFSMGLLIPAPVGAKVGEDYQERLGITKYDPTSDRILTRAGNGMAEVDPGFLPTYGVGSLRRDRIFEDGEIVYYTEKCHGSCFASVFTSDKFWVKSHHVMRKPPHEVTAKELARYDRDLFIYRLKSIVNPMLRLCRLPQFKAPVKPFTVKEDVFWQTARLYGLEEICRANPNLAFYGEVYGTTQKGYMYDSIGEPKFACFDIYNIKTQSYMDCEEMMHICKRFNVQTVPELYVGPYSIDKVKELSEGKTTLGGKHLREGVVVKSAPGRPRKIAKYVSTSYLLEQGKE